MRFYTKTHQHYCGIDLHAKTMYLCLLDREGQILLPKNLRSRTEAFLEAVAPFRDDLVVTVECIFTWYWLADLLDGMIARGRVSTRCSAAECRSRHLRLLNSRQSEIS